MSSSSSTIDDLGREQEYVSMLYARLDALRERTSHLLAATLRETGGTPQARSQRDTTVHSYSQQITRLDAVENGLCFGRLDSMAGARRYIGRIGLFDDNHGGGDGHRGPDGGDTPRAGEPLLIDWRAPAARAFYLATAASPDGVRLRRHIRTRDRRVTGVDDEVLDLETARHTAGDDLTGEAALMSALNASRTGRMRDIVDTIQAEQDRIIRDRMDGVLVVQGGPGTGKTAVALHRAAYLLYTHRRVLSTRGVLIVGPNDTFLRYISQVLPSLAETGVLLATLGDLYPGITARRVESPATAAIKGRPVMVDVLAAAVRDRQRVPDDHLDIEVDRETLRLDRDTCLRARARARSTGRPHNLARPIFEREIIEALARQEAERIGADPLGGANLLDEQDVEDIRRELRGDPGVRSALDWLWPTLTPQRLLADLFADADRIATAAPQLTAAERDLLRRDPTPPGSRSTHGSRSARGGWTPADVPLLDEAAELLGDDDSLARAEAARRRRAEIAYAQGVLDLAGGSRATDADDEVENEILSVFDLVDADRLAERNQNRDFLTTAERAAMDRTWAFGHVIVDEAQELSPLAWRLLMRRCPSRSLTVVGDVAQAGALGGTSSWRDALEPYVADRWRLAELRVNYRTPAEIMAVAADVLAAIDPTLSPPSSVRDTGVRPWHRRVRPEILDESLAALVRAEVAELGTGRLAVIVPAGRVGGLRAAIAAALPAEPTGMGDPDDPRGVGTGTGGKGSNLESRVAVLAVRQAKGLEFDRVLVVDPAGMVAESPRGYNDLYVALTRATQRLGVVHAGEILPVLAGYCDESYAMIGGWSGRAADH